jgi:RND family efflux transporter MFP subunit
MTRLLRKRVVVVCLLGLAAGGVLLVVLKTMAAKDMAEPERARKKGKPIPVRTETVKESRVEEVLGATAVTQPYRSVAIELGPSRNVISQSPTTNVALRTLHVRDGDRVRAGQLLAELDDRLYRESMKQQQAALAAAKASLERARVEIPTRQKLRELGLASSESNLEYRTADLENRTKALDVYSKLYATRAASSLDYFNSRSLFYDARFNKSEAVRGLQRSQVTMKVGPYQDKEDMAKAESDHEAARVALALLKHDVGRLRLTSPLDGYIDLRGKDEPPPGAMVAVGQPLFYVLQLDPMLVKLDFPQERIDDVQVGQKAEVVLDAFPKETFRGTVLRILPQANPQLRVVPVVVEVKNPKGRIKTGLTGFVRIRVRRKALVVPSTAVLERGSKATVFRVEDGRARVRPIRTGFLVRTGMVEVRDGLRAGDEVVIFHNFYYHWGKLTSGEGYLQDNDRVDVNWRRWSRRE